MSWMDSWSRPSKSQATPPPQYLIPGGEATPYCHSCGRIISSRKAQPAKDSKATPIKYCSARCRNNKPGKVDREIEAGFVSLLTGTEALPGAEAEQSKNKAKGKGQKKKGETRILVPCSAVENLVFGDQKDPSKVYGRKKDRAKRGVPDAKEWKSVDMVSGSEDGPAGYQDSDGGGNSTDGGMSIDLDGDVKARLSIRSGTRIRPPQGLSEVNGGVGGEKGVKERIEETDEMLEKRREGQRRAEEKEMVRCAARRGVAFGFLVSGEDGKEEKRTCEAVMLGKVVESSYAKGDWGIRWRE